MTKHFFINAPLVPGSLTLPRALARRLHRVLRLKKSQEIALFNGHDGLWRATLDNPAEGLVTVTQQIKQQPAPTHRHLLLALAKRDAFDRALRQATELGVSHIHPIITDRCVPDKLNTERLHTILEEAAEQSERLTIPVLTAPKPLQEKIAGCPFPVFWADEGAPQQTTQKFERTSEETGLLIGPEGGFSEEERTWLHAQAPITPLSLGETILRVDTAVCAGLTLLLKNFDFTRELG